MCCVTGSDLLLSDPGSLSVMLYGIYDKGGNSTSAREKHLYAPGWHRAWHTVVPRYLPTGNLGGIKTFFRGLVTYSEATCSHSQQVPRLGAPKMEPGVVGSSCLPRVHGHVPIPSKTSRYHIFPNKDLGVSYLFLIRCLTH